VGITCTPESPLEKLVEIPIVLDVGPEALAGSTRLKAGSAQKIVLNMLSTAVMKQLGRIWRGEMVAMRPTNEKLKRRAARIVERLLGLTAEEADALLHASDWNLPVALLSGRWGLTAEKARERLDDAGGNVARALEEAIPVKRT
ncbi:MAG TPA: N-acetylmuramic acid 6-phosphate etherase, partial [Thermoanaerobaculia bacterium]|nr:N-acetylmuramic acid 6-phosphate etherase [Thermoanaerobaculia bacterium]